MTVATFADVEAAIAALPEDVFRVGRSAAQPATEAEVAAIERQLGAPVVPELRELMLRWGALAVEVNEQVWPRVEAMEVVPSWRHWHGFRVLGAGAGLPAELAIAGAQTRELHAHAALPVIRRTGASWLTVMKGGALATWAPGGGLTPLAGTLFDAILAELHALETGVQTLRTTAAADAAPVAELVARMDAAGWEGAEVGAALDRLKTRTADELLPHVEPLVDGLLGGPLTMGLLDVLAAAGHAAFLPVADRVYDHFAEDDAESVIELLGALHDVSPRALALYREGLEHDDEDVQTRTVDVLRALAALPAVWSLLPAVEARLDGAFDDADHRHGTLALAGILGIKDFAVRVEAALAEVESDEDFASLVTALHGLAPTVASLAPRLLARFREMDPTEWPTLAAIEGLVELGIEDRDAMSAVVREHFLGRGAQWTPRAQALLARWAG